MIAVGVLVICMALVAWVYAGYPLLLLLIARLRPRPRRRADLLAPISVIIAAHDEAEGIADKLADVRASRYPHALVETIVASDGSTDATVGEAHRAGASIVLELPRVGKLTALDRAVAASSGEILVFTDADARFEPDTLRELVANFADPEVGGAGASEVRLIRRNGRAVARGEGLYWRYEQWIKRLEDEVGSVVSASGRLYAVRRELFRSTTTTAGTDDFVISTQVVLQGRRLAFDARAIVLVDAPEAEDVELRRKVRVMNRGLRAAFALRGALLPSRTGFYAVQVWLHKILRRFVAFFLLAALAASAVLAAGDALWWLILGPQLAFYGLALIGVLLSGTRWSRARLLWIPCYFCLANGAAALAVLSLLGGVRFELWEPATSRGDARR